MRHRRRAAAVTLKICVTFPTKETPQGRSGPLPIQENTSQGCIKRSNVNLARGLD